ADVPAVVDDGIDLAAQDGPRTAAETLRGEDEPLLVADEAALDGTGALQFPGEPTSAISGLESAVGHSGLGQFAQNDLPVATPIEPEPLKIFEDGPEGSEPPLAPIDADPSGDEPSLPAELGDEQPGQPGLPAEPAAVSDSDIFAILNDTAP